MDLKDYKRIIKDFLEIHPYIESGEYHPSHWYIRDMYEQFPFEIVPFFKELANSKLEKTNIPIDVFIRIATRTFSFINHPTPNWFYYFINDYLYSEDLGIRDECVNALESVNNSYLACMIFESYIPTEKVEWLKTYAKKIHQQHKNKIYVKHN